VLTLDLVRARRQGGRVRPRYVGCTDSALLARADALCNLFAAHLQKPRGQLEDAIAEQVGEDTDVVLHRGLAKLLFDRSVFETCSPIDPIELRRRVFAQARLHHPVASTPGDPLHPTTAAEVCARVGAELDLTGAQVLEALYADLEREQRMTAHEPLTPQTLLQRYDVALAQAVLLRATALVVQLPAGSPKRARQLFRYVKFFGLMHTVEGDRRQGYRVTLDGPASLFSLSTKYGVRLAQFLPALLRCEGWSLQAQLLWGKERAAATFELDPSQGLISHFPDKGVFETEEERTLIERFEALGSRWKISRAAELIDLGGRGVLVPDLVFTHRDDGREARLEIVGFWRRGYLERRLALLRAHGPPNLILAVSRKLAAARDVPPDLPGELYVFGDLLRAKEILARVERCARV
jgi:predicted nuclease of restriction endonuclease-like RecB superfamily